MSLKVALDCEKYTRATKKIVSARRPRSAHQGKCCQHPREVALDCEK